MKIHIVQVASSEGNSGGYLFSSSIKQAKADFKENNQNHYWTFEDNYTTADLIPTKKGILNFLNTHASHPDNG